MVFSREVSKFKGLERLQGICFLNWREALIRGLEHTYLYYLLQNIAILTLTSPVGINVPTRSVLVIETKDSFVSLVTDMNNTSNVCKQGCLL